MIAALWLLACAGGLLGLWRYESRPSDPGAPPIAWPSIDLRHASDGPTLVMVAHPRCPCTRASLAELDELLRDAPAGVRSYVVFSVPDGVEPGWENGELLDRARAIRGVTAVVDHGGRIAVDAFHVAASGHVLVYDASGALRFSGGITGARGHVGDNVGRQRVLALLTGHRPDADHSHVYGCALEDPE